MFRPYLNLDENKKKKLSIFVDLLLKWNKTHNLTSIQEKKDIVNKHIFDSLSIRDYLKGDEVLDVGSGGGFPGIPLAIFFPEKKFTLIDSAYKKIVFLSEAKRVLNLSNIKCIHSRVEALTKKSFDVITSRAFGSTSVILKKTSHLIKKDGVWLLMKGAHAEEDFQDQKQEFNMRIEQLLVPRGANYHRHLVIINRAIN